MKKFLIDMVKADNPTSSKRVAALTTLASTIVLAFVATFKNNWICPEFMYDGLLMVVAGLFGFNMAENIFKKSGIATAPVVTVPDLDAPVVPPVVTKQAVDVTVNVDQTADAGKVAVDNPDA